MVFSFSSDESCWLTRDEIPFRIFTSTLSLAPAFCRPNAVPTSLLMVFKAIRISRSKEILTFECLVYRFEYAKRISENSARYDFDLISLHFPIIIT